MKNKIIFVIYLFLFFSFTNIFALSQNTQVLELTLKQAQEIALKQYPMIAASKEELNISQNKQKQAVAMTKPQVAIASYLTNTDKQSILKTPDFVMPQSIMSVPSKTFLNLGLMGMYPLYTGGRLKAMVDFTSLGVDISSFNLTATKLNTILMVQEYYKMALYAKELVKVYEELVARSEEQYRIDKTSFEVGKIPQYYIFRDEAEVADAKQMLANMQRDYEVALVNLKEVLALDQNTKIVLSDNLEYIVLENKLDDLVNDAIKNSPELSIYSKMIAQSQQELKLAESEFKPQVSVAVMSGAMKQETMPLSSTYSLGVVSALPVFDAGLRKEKKQAAQNMLKKSQADYESKKLETISQVNKFYLSLLTAEKNIKTNEVAVQSAKEDYRVARLRYDAGKGIQVEVLDASFSVLRAQTNYFQALYEFLITKDRLFRVIGYEEIN